jgi:hypothetical protein
MEDFKGPVLLQLGEDVVDETPAAVGCLHIRRTMSRKQRRWRICEKCRKLSQEKKGVNRLTQRYKLKATGNNSATAAASSTDRCACIFFFFSGA